MLQHLDGVVVEAAQRAAITSRAAAVQVVMAGVVVIDVKTKRIVAERTKNPQNAKKPGTPRVREAPGREW